MIDGKAYIITPTDYLNVFTIILLHIRSLLLELVVSVRPSALLRFVKSNESTRQNL
jgi:hypothetical protein